MKNSCHSLKPLITSLFLALGLTPFGGEIFADVTADPKSNVSSVFTGNVVQNTHYAPQLNLGGFYGNNGNSYGEADVWLPVWQSASSVAYADVRYQKDENTQWDFAAGGGYRWLSDDMERLYDVYGFYNTYNSSYNNQFQQLMGGGSFRTDNWTVRGNYYYSVGPTQYNVASLDNLSYAPIGGIQYNGLISYGFENNYINGGVVEVGRTIPYSPGLSLFGGYYGFASSDARPFVNGFRARAEYRLDEAFNFKTPFVRHITLESMYQYDNVYQGAFTVGARLDIPLGKSYTNSKLQDAMMDYVRFYPHAVQENVMGAVPVIYTQGGVPVVFDLVNNTKDFKTAIQDNSNVVVVLEDLQLGEQAVVANNKYITGQNFEYETGKFINVTGNSTIATITGATGQNIFMIGSSDGTVGLNDTIRDLNLTTTGQSSTPTTLLNAVGTPVVTENQNAGWTVGTLTIDHIATNGGIFIYSNNLSTPSTVSITNSIFTPDFVQSSNNNVTSAIYINGVNAPVYIGNIDGNTITFSDNPDNLTLGAYFYERGIYLNTQQGSVGSVSNNHINFGDASLSQAIYIVNNSSSTQNIGSVDGNIIVYGKDILVSDVTLNYFRSIYIGNNTTANQTIGSVSNNQITFGEGLGLSHTNKAGAVVNVYGINIGNNDGNQTITSVSNNIINFSDVTLNSNLATGGFILSGLYISSTGPLQQIGSVNNNSVDFGNVTSTITAGNGLSSVSGILLEMYNPNLVVTTGPTVPISQTVDSFDNNTINFNGNISVSNVSQARSVLSGLFVKNFSGANQSQRVNSIDSNQVNFKSTVSSTGSYVSGFEFFSIGADIAAVNGQPIQYAQQFSLTNNTVSFASGGVGANIYGYHVNQSAWALGSNYSFNTSTVNVTSFYGNSASVAGVTNSSTPGIFLFNDSGSVLGAISIKINAPNPTDDLSAANNGLTVTENPADSNNINIMA